MNINRRKFIGGLALASAGTLTCTTVVASSLPNIFRSDEKMSSGNTLKFKRKLHHRGVLQAVWSPDGKRLVSAGGHYALWDPHTGEKIHELSAPLASIRQDGPVRFTADGRYVVVALNSRVDGVAVTFGLWNVKTGEIDRQIPFPKKHFARRIGGDPWFMPLPGQQLAVAAYEASTPPYRGEPILLYDTTTWEVVDELLQMPRNGARCFDISPDGRLLAIGNWRLGPYVGEPRGRIEIFDIASRKQVRVIEGAHKDTPHHLNFSPDSRYIASSPWEVGSKSRNMATDKMEEMWFSDPVRVWDVDTGQKVASFGDSFPGVSNLVFHPNEPWLAASVRRSFGNAKGPGFRIWDWQAGTELALINPFSASAQHIAFSPDGRYVAMAGENKEMWAQDGIEIAEISDS